MRIVSLLCAALFATSVHALPTDSLSSIVLPDVEVSTDYQYTRNRTETAPIEYVGRQFLLMEHSGSLSQTLSKLPGIHSMNIGAGFSKPSIRGMAFNRIVVAENGVKQEGQQWGADHGLEIDVFNIEQVEIRKGASSLQYGSDAMGGAIEIGDKNSFVPNAIVGDVSLIGKSNNALWGISTMLGFSKQHWAMKFRFTEQHWGDYGIPTDTISYLTWKIPVYNRKLKNTAGLERNLHAQFAYQKANYTTKLFVSNAYQKVGFFPGSHGIPSIERVQPDALSRNIDLPNNNVNHLKAQWRQQLLLDASSFEWNLAYQNNHRQEWSLFHTHYPNQQAPEKNPELELEFRIETASSNLKWSRKNADDWNLDVGMDVQFQRNTIDGYGFLLPEFIRYAQGLYAYSSYQSNAKVRWEGGLRYDAGFINTASFRDDYLASYLTNKGYSPSIVEEYAMRSEAVNRRFGDFSGTLGMVYDISTGQLLKWHFGRSFRLPGANELSSNGLHHGAFRHEQGDATLPSEKAWQLDLAYMYSKGSLTISVSPFVSWFDNYIYLNPTGEWSLLPHAGQIYRYTAQKALFAGGELSIGVRLSEHFRYAFSGEYVYTYNLDEKMALPYSPPSTIRNRVEYKNRLGILHIENELIAAQNRISRNEERTPGACLFHAGLQAKLSFSRTVDLNIGLSIQNIFNTQYFNHLSFYRRLEIPEPGRNIQLIINIPLKKIAK